MGFLINPYIYASSVVDSGSIDLTASPTQDDFDIDMTGFDELEVWLVDCDTNNSVVPEIFGSNDGGSTFKTTAGEYLYTYGYLGEEDLGTGLRMWGQDNSTINHLYAYTRLVGFNHSATGPMAIGWMGRDDATSSSSRHIHGVMNFANVDTVRLGTLSEWGSASGNIYWKKIAYTNIAEHESYDYSVDTSSTSFIAVDGTPNYDEVWTFGNDIDASLSNRFETGYSTDGSTINTTAQNNWNVQVRNSSVTDNSYLLWSGDDGNPKHATPHIIWGTAGTGYPILSTGGTGLSDFGGIQYGRINSTTALTDIAFSEFDDAQNYNAGTVEGVKLQWLSSTAGTGSWADTSTTLNLDITGYDRGIMTVDFLAMGGTADQIFVTISTDGGSTYESTGYSFGRGGTGSSTFLTSQSSFQSELYAATNGVIYLNWYGAEAGKRFAIQGTMGPATGANPMHGLWTGGTSAVTDIKLTLQGTATVSGATNYGYHFWNAG